MLAMQINLKVHFLSFGVSFLIHFLVFATYLFELFVILPKLYEDENSRSIKQKHILLGTWILLNLLASFWKFVLTCPGLSKSIALHRANSNWIYCTKCEIHSPPRSFHCRQCCVCVLTRDHHCMIGSNCVGYENRRFFLTMNIYFLLALFYANFFNVKLSLQLFYTWQYKSLLTVTFPLLGWMFGYNDGESLVIALFTSFCVVSMIYASSVFAFHFRNTLKGRTTYEMQKNLGSSYDLGLTRNLEHAFGKYWLISWICPFLPSPLPGDGVSWEEKELSSHSKKDL